MAVSVIVKGVDGSEEYAYFAEFQGYAHLMDTVRVSNTGWFRAVLGDVGNQHSGYVNFNNVVSVKENG